MMLPKRLCCQLPTLLAVAFAAHCVCAAPPVRNETAIAEIAAGKAKQAVASWWGFDPSEATAALQAAIDSGAPKLIVDKQASPWIVDKIRLQSDQEIVFEPGVEVLAKKDAFRGTSDALFSAWDCQNVKLLGPGATLRMRRDDYARPPYQKAEWRHALSLRGCRGVTVSGLTLAESGGDGIYLAGGRKSNACRDVVIRDVTCDRNYRQGISVISAENLLIENCTLKNTAGTAPAAGIDFEPNAASEKLVNCVMRNCAIEDNQGYGLHIYARPLTGASPEMSLRIENCVTRGRNARSASIVTANGGESGAVKGRIEFVRCRFEDAGTAGLVIGSKPVDGARLRFEDCLIADASTDPVQTPPILLNSRMGDSEDLGGIEFANLTIRERAARPLLRFDDKAGLMIRAVSGTINVQRDGNREQIVLDQETLDHLLPANRFMRFKAWDMSGSRWEPVNTSQKPLDKLPRLQLREQGVFWIAAKAGETVRCELRQKRVGRSDGPSMPVRVLSPSGREVAKAQVPLDQQAAVSFPAAESGVYQVLCLPVSHTVQMMSCSHAFCLGGRGSAIHFVATPGDFYFYVPAGVRTFAVRVQGDGDAERVGATLFDAAGKAVWSRPNLGGPEFQEFNRADGSPGEIWRLQLAKAPQGVLEDHYVELRGVPAILALTPDSVLRPSVQAVSPASR